MDGVIHAYAYRGGELRLHAYEGAGGATAAGEQSLRVRAPGVGDFEFGPVEVEWQGEILEIATQVSGKNLAYLYTELLLKDEERDAYYGPVSREFVRAQTNKSVGGISHPEWGDVVEVSALLRPALRLLTNGADFSFCFALPEGYSSQGYRQGGLYTLAGETVPLRALLGFSDEGALTRAVAHRENERRTGARGRAGAKVLTPSENDRFAPFAQVLTPSGAGGGWDIGAALGDTLTLGSLSLRVVTEKALPGEYLVGVIAQDFDGGLQRKYTSVRLES